MCDLFFFLIKTLELVAQTERTRQGSLKTTMTLMMCLTTYLKALKRHTACLDNLYDNKKKIFRTMIHHKKGTGHSGICNDTLKKTYWSH